MGTIEERVYMIQLTLINKFLGVAIKSAKKLVSVMNRKQKICLWIGLSIVAILVVYPPYCCSLEEMPFSFGHRNILRPLTFDKIELQVYAKEKFGIDVCRLLLEWLLIGVITTGGIWAFSDKKNKKAYRDSGVINC